MGNFWAGSTATANEPPPAAADNARSRPRSPGLDNATDTQVPPRIRRRLSTAREARINERPRAAPRRSARIMRRRRPVPEAAADSYVDPPEANTRESATSTDDGPRIIDSFTSSPLGQSVLRQALETVLFNLLTEQDSLRTGAEDETVNISSFYFYGSFLASMEPVPDAPEQQVANTNENINEDVATGTINITGNVLDFAQRQDAMPRASIHRSLTDNLTAINVVNGSNSEQFPLAIRIPLIIIGMHQSSDEQSAEDGDETSGWIMYIVGGPSTSEALESLTTTHEVLQQMSRSANYQARVVGLSGRFVVVTDTAVSRAAGDANEPIPFDPENPNRPPQTRSGLFIPPGASDAEHMAAFSGHNMLLANILARLGNISFPNSANETVDLNQLDDTDREGASYEIFTRLAELMGPAIPRNVREDDVDREIPVISLAEWSQYVKNKRLCDGHDTSAFMSCSICLDPFKAADFIRLLTCDHGFHKGCIDAWLCGHVNNCPLCRTTAVSAASSTR